MKPLNACKDCPNKRDGCMNDCTEKIASDLVNWIENDKINKARREYTSKKAAYYELKLKRCRIKPVQMIKK